MAMCGALLPVQCRHANSMQVRAASGHLTCCLQHSSLQRTTHEHGQTLCRWRKQPWRTAAIWLTLTLAVRLAAHYGTVAHPYLLADNRHLTFYLWKDIIGPLHPYPWLTAPAYGAAALAATTALASAQGGAWLLAYAVCAAAALVPAGLLELRYFIVPTVVAALRLPMPLAPQLAVQAVCFAAVNAAVLWMFCGRSFTWHDGSVARIMW